MYDSIDLLPTQEEQQNYFTLFDVATLIDTQGIDYVLSSVVRSLNNPMQQHLVKQLLNVYTVHEPLLLSMKDASCCLVVKESDDEAQ